VKKIFSKNQVVLTVLAAMIAVAGYLTYAKDNAQVVDNLATEQAVDSDLVGNALTDLSDEDILAENIAMEQAKNLESEESTELVEETETAQPGEAVLTNSNVTDFMEQIKLNREQVRSANKESLNEIIENQEISESQKQSALDSLVHMTEVSELESQIENLLSTKGIENTVVTINDENVDVVVGMSEITDSQRAQIEDVVKRKADVSVSQIVISLMDEGK
jgi:stage III sporulation protein AH